MLYTRNRISNVWQDISEYLRFDISWKRIVCGWPCYDISNSKILSYNLILTIVGRTIFKSNLQCKFEDRPYNECNIWFGIVGVLF